MYYRLGLIALVLVLCCPGVLATAPARGPVGLDSLNRLDLLPYLWIGRSAGHFSSHDLTGNNADRGWTTSPNCLFDVKGAGCIYRIWCTLFDGSVPTLSGDIKIYIDGNPTPKVSTTLANFFSGNYSIFQYPLAGYSSGGFFSYVPIPFRTSCKIIATLPSGTTREKYLYYNVDYIKFDTPDGVTSFTGTENTAQVRQQWQNVMNNPGEYDPKQVPTPRSATGQITVPNNGSITYLPTISGPGSISRVRMRVGPNGYVSPEHMDKLTVKLFFDGHTNPAVYTTFGRFFGGDMHRPDYINIGGLLFGMNKTTGWNYNYYPMPFGSAALIGLTNTGPAPVTISYDIGISDMPDAQRLLDSGQVGYFTSTQTIEPVTAVLGNDYILMDQVGRGVVVGMVYTPSSIPGSGSRKYLEGDERVHIDASLTPQIYGTGTEDTFNGGWYFWDGEFSTPTHGFTYYLREDPERRSLYRLLLGDQIPFSGRVIYGFECGVNNDGSGCQMRSTMFYYLSPADARLYFACAIDVGNGYHENRYNYTLNAASSWMETNSSAYEGDNNTLFTDSGRHFTNGYSEFDLVINPNNFGIKLRRLLYYAIANQSAVVYVDGQQVGLWYDAGSNPYLCWRESDFDIPSQYTQGKSTIRVKVVSTGTWTEYRYRAYSYISPSNKQHKPAVADDGAAMSATDSLHFTITPPNEPVWGVAAYRYAVGTTPGGADVADWVETAVKSEITLHDLPTQSGETYYISCLAKNGAGVWSDPAVTDGITVAPSIARTSISDAKSASNATQVLVHGVVTAVFDGLFYIEDVDRTAGIKVISAEPVVLGEYVDIEGIISLANGERYVTASHVAKNY